MKLIGQTRFQVREREGTMRQGEVRGRHSDWQLTAFSI